MKTCTKCKQAKPATDFPIRRRATDGLDCWCKSCKAADQIARYRDDLEKGRAINRRSTVKRRSRKRAEDRAYAARTKPQKRDYDRARQLADPIKAAYRVAVWKTANRARINDQTNQRRRANPAIRLAHNIGVQMRHALRGSKDAPWQKLVGYSVIDLKAHLESCLPAR